MNGNRHADSEKHQHDSQQVELESSLLERMEKTRADLKTYREHEQNQAEVLHETEHGRIDPESEMAQDDGHEQDPGRTDGNTFDLELSKIQSRRHHYGENQDGMGDPRPKKQISHINL